MKKLLSLSVLLLAAHSVFAQPWLQAGSAPQKLAGIVAAYRAQHPSAIPANGSAATGGSLFDKWEWYWQQHLDKDGYMVPGGYTAAAWQQYTSRLADSKGLARTTSSLPSNWVFQGPASSAGGYSGIGRVNAIALDPIDSNVFYAGSASGGTWKTTNGGLTWSSLYDFLPSLGVSDIKVNPLNGNTIYVATGDAEAGDSYSSGIIYSRNGGATWLASSFSWLPTDNNFVRSLVINPQDTARLIAGTNAGVYKSFDAGATWTNVAPGNFKQLCYKPGDSSIIYGTVYSDTSAQIVRSLNGGLTWSSVTHFSGAQRIAIAVCPASPAVVKAIVCDAASGLQGIYSSSDNGATFTPIYTEDGACSHELLGYDIGLPTYTCGGKAWYAMCIAIDPSDANKVTIGGINTYHSADGGATWQVSNGWYDDMSGLPVVHANKHMLAYSPVSHALYEACDGGIYRAYSPLGAPWTDLSNGLGITQFYRVAVDNGVPFCIGGAQDNGSKKLTGTSSVDLAGGNGTQPLINYGDPSHVFYCSSQNGYILMTRDGGAYFSSITSSLPVTGGFLAPYVLHPADTATLYLGYKSVYVSHDNGASWAGLSPVFDTGAYIKRIAVSTHNPSFMFVTVDRSSGTGSRIAYSATAGTTWDTIHVPATNVISDIAVDPRDEHHFWITISGYGSSKVMGYSLTSNVWTDESGSLPDLPVNCMVVDTQSRARYVGTDAAVFYKDTLMSDWVLYNNHLPVTHIYDLKINYTSGQLWAATYGRGMWTTTRGDDPGTLGLASVQSAVLQVYPNPAHDRITIASAVPALAGATVAVRLLTATGRIVADRSATFSAGAVTIATAGLAPGLYFCQVQHGAQVYYAGVTLY